VKFDIDKHSSLCFFVLSAIVVVLIYLPVINAPFLLDDFSSIVKNPNIRSLDFNAIYNFAPLRYLAYLSFALNFHFFQLDPFSYHTVNITIHILYVWAVFFLTQLVWKTPAGKASDLSGREKNIISFASVMILAVHPLSAFAVSYVVQRIASLTGFFYVASLCFYLKARLAGKGYPRGMHCFFFVLFLVCALFTKQNAFTIFPQLIILELVCFKMSTRKGVSLLGCLGMLLILLVVLLINNTIDLNEIRELTTETHHITRFEYLITQFSVVLFYLSQLVFPNRLAIDYHHVVYSSIANPAVFIPGVVLLLIIGGAVFALFRKNTRLAAWGILFYFTAISLESSIIPIRDTVFLHRTYLPNAGLFFSVTMLVCLGLKKIKAPDFAGIVLIVLSVGIFSFLTLKTNHIFQTPLAVWQNVVEKSPESARGHNSMGRYLLSLNRLDQARGHLLKSYNLQPGNFRNLNNLGILYKKERQYDQAVEVFETIIAGKKKFTPAYTGLGNTYLAMKQYKLAIETYRTGYHYNKDDYAHLLNFAQILATTAAPGDLKQLNEALNMLNRAESINNRDYQLFYAKGIALYNLKRDRQAENCFKQSLKLNPGCKQAAGLLKMVQAAIY
jgi:tetratricopeptide (TPR) repeat protein